MSTFTEFQPLKETIVGKPFSPKDFDNVKDQQAKDLLKRILLNF